MEFKFHLGPACNLRCEYCNIEKVSEVDTNYMPIFFREMDKCLNDGVRITKVLLTGGEPTLYHDQVIDFLNKYHDKCDKISIVSNGTNINEIEEYSKYSNVQLNISYDGHINARGFDSFNSIKELVSRGVKINIMYVINNLNYDKIIDDLLELEQLDPKLPHRTELLMIVAHKEYYKWDMDILKDSLRKVMKRYPNLSLFQSGRSKRCIHVDRNDTMIEVKNGVVVKGCVNYAHMRNEAVYKVVDCKDPRYNICLNCDNEFCHTCANRLIKDLYENEFNFEKDGKYWNTIRCKFYRIIRDLKHEQYRNNFLYEKIIRTDRVELLMTTGCNMACTYCVENGVKTNGIFMSNDIIDKVVLMVKKIEDVGKVKPRITLFGGEPLMSECAPTIKHLLDKMSELNVSAGIEIFTNGYNFSNDIIELLRRMVNEDRLKLIQFSIDGLKDVHDSRRRDIHGNPTFDSVMESLNRISEFVPTRNIVINSVLNYDKIPETLEWVLFADKMVKSGKIFACDIKLDQVRSIPLSNLQMKQMIDLFNTVASKYKNGEITVAALKSVFNIFNIHCDLSRNAVAPGCGICNGMLTIKPNGEFIPCHVLMKDQSLVLGKMVDDDYEASENIYEIWDIFGGHGGFRCDGRICDDCMAFDVCDKCKAVEYTKHGNPIELNPLKCTLKSLSIKILHEHGIKLENFRRLTVEEVKELQVELQELQKVYQESEPNLTDEEKVEFLMYLSALTERMKN